MYVVTKSQSDLELFKKLLLEVGLTDVTSGPEDPHDLRINITAPADEEREFDLMDMASLRSADILLEYGYSILVMPTRSVWFPRDKFPGAILTETGFSRKAQFLLCPFSLPQGHPNDIGV